MRFKSLSELYDLPKKQRWGSKKKIVKQMLVYFRVTGDDECCQIVAWAIARVCNGKTKRKVLVLLCEFLQTQVEYLSEEQHAELTRALTAHKLSESASNSRLV